MISLDLLLMLVAFGGIAVGVFLPWMAAPLQPLILPCMMLVLFLAFLAMKFTALVRTTGHDLLELALWSLIKLIALPLAAWAVLSLVAPQWALPALVLCGISSGVTSPFFADLLGADMGHSLRLLVVTSALAPLTLPGLVQWLEGRTTSLDYWDMASMLALVIFAPMALSRLVRRISPRATDFLVRIRRPINLVTFGIINMAVFSRYSEFLLGHAHDFMAALGLACVLDLVFLGVSLGVGFVGRGRLDTLSGAVGMCFVNNILATVFASRFFAQPEPALLTAIYTLPFFANLVPLRLYARSRGTRQ